MPSSKFLSLACALLAGVALGAETAKFDAIVSADAPGAYRTLQEAVAAAPDDGQKPFRILLKPGTYRGQWIVPKQKRRIRLVGEVAERTIITHTLNQNEAPAPGAQPVFNNAGTVILADDFSAENVTFENTSGDHGQALALRVDGDRAVFTHCRLLGWQDTLLLSQGRQYFAGCHIEGRVDFIYGAATAVFERCEIHTKNGGHITAASTPREHAFGFVFLNCKLTGDPGPWRDANGQVADAKPNPMANLGRPWRPFASVTWLNCEMGAHIRPAGWDNWRNSDNEKTARFAEFNSTGPGANPAQRAPWSRQLGKDEAGEITVEAVLGGSDRWNPLARH